MAERNEALVKPALLLWARAATHTSLEDAASSVGVPADRLIDWESGTSRPTVRQLRLLANKYHLPLAAFYLPEPPEYRLPRMRDYRSPVLGDPYEDRTLMLEIRHAIELSSIAADLDPSGDFGVLSFPEILQNQRNAATIGVRIREYLNLDLQVQKSWPDERVAFNAMRTHAEAAGLLVLQTSKVPIEQFRALSLPDAPIPTILINRKDAYAGRTFSILHEISHLMLRTPAICSLQPETITNEANRYTEILCNASAAEALVPKQDFQKQVAALPSENGTWSDSSLRSLARRYGCSREVILRRLLEVELTTQEFYEQERQRFAEEFSKHKSKKNVVIPPPVDTLSRLGHRYISTVMAALDRGDITHNDFSDFTDLRLKHLEDLRVQL